MRITSWTPEDGEPSMSAVGEGLLMPTCVGVTLESDDAHTVELVVAVEAGKPVVESVTLRRNPSVGELLADDVRRIPIGEMFDMAVDGTLATEWVASEQNPDGRQGGYSVLANPDAVAAVLRANRPRASRVDEDLLRRVAKALTERRDAGKTMERVANDLGYHVSNLYRLRGRAKRETDPATGRPYLIEDGEKR